MSDISVFVYLTKISVIFFCLPNATFLYFRGIEMGITYHGKRFLPFSGANVPFYLLNCKIPRLLSCVSRSMHLVLANGVTITVRIHLDIAL